MRVPKPAKHGRDHCKGGEDEIPCLVELQDSEVLNPTRPWATRSHTSTQIIPSGVVEQLTFNVSEASTDATEVDILTNGIQLLKSGLWIVTCVISWETAASGQAYILVNNTAAVFVSGQSETTYLSATKKHMMLWSHPDYVSNGQVYAYFFQASGGSRNVYARYLNAVWIGDITGTPNQLF